MFRKLALSGAALLALAIAAWAATIPVVVHKNAAGIDEDSVGVVLIDKDTGDPYNASAGGGGGDATAANQVTTNTKLDTLHADVDGMEGLTGAVTETAPATDTASSGLNGRSQRIAQRLSSLITALTNSIVLQAGTNNIGFVSLAAGTTGGCTPYHVTSAASTNSTLISTGAHTLCSLSVVNTTATIYYFRLYDASGAPTCSSATGAVASYPIPASASGAGIAPSFGIPGVAFTSGLGFCLTGGGSDTDNTNAATGVYVNAAYK